MVVLVKEHDGCEELTLSNRRRVVMQPVTREGTSGPLFWEAWFMSRDGKGNMKRYYGITQGDVLVKLHERTLP